MKRELYREKENKTNIAYICWVLQNQEALDCRLKPEASWVKKTQISLRHRKILMKHCSQEKVPTSPQLQSVRLRVISMQKHAGCFYTQIYMLITASLPSSSRGVKPFAFSCEMINSSFSCKKHNNYSYKFSLRSLNWLVPFK